MVRNSGIAEREWPVYANYKLRKRSFKRIDILLNDPKIERYSTRSLNETVEVDAIFKAGREVKSYSLANIDVHDELFKDYTNIYTTTGALDFVKRWGFLSDNFKQGYLVTEILDSAEYLRWLMLLSESTNMKNKNWLKMLIKPTKWKTAIGIILNDPFKPVHPFATEDLNGIYQSVRVPEDPLIYSIQEWDDYGRWAYLYVAQDYLRRTMIKLMNGSQIMLDWEKTDSGDWVPEERVLISTPWQAICYGLLRNINGKRNLILCKHCGKKRFHSKRKDNIFCSALCSRSHNRQHGQTIHSYSKRRKNA